MHKLYRVQKELLTRTTKILLAFGLGVSTLLFVLTPANAATLTSASLRLQDSRPSQVNQYTLSASGFSTGTTIGCIEVDLGTSANGSGSPAGLSTASSSFVSQSITATGTWAVDNSQSASQILRLTNATPVVPQAGAQTAVWGAVTNGSVADTAYFGVIKTYTTNSCATPVDTVSVQFIYTNGQAVSVTVDPSLSFTVAGKASGLACNGVTTNVATTASTVPFGTVNASTNGIAAQDLTISTNAGNGYTVAARYTGLPLSGSNDINDHSGTNVTPTVFSAAGTEAFGFTTDDATLGTGTANRYTAGGAKWAAFTTTNTEVAYSAAAISNETRCVAQQVGISATTPAGAYTTTVIYTATPVY